MLGLLGSAVNELQLASVSASSPALSVSWINLSVLLDPVYKTPRNVSSQPYQFRSLHVCGESCFSFFFILLFFFKCCLICSIYLVY